MFCFEQRMTRPASFAITSLQIISSSTSNEQWRAELQRRPTRGSVSLHTFKSVKAGLKPVRKILAARSKIATSESLRREVLWSPRGETAQFSAALNNRRREKRESSFI